MEAGYVNEDHLLKEMLLHPHPPEAVPVYANKIHPLPGKTRATDPSKTGVCASCEVMFDLTKHMYAILSSELPYCHSRKSTMHYISLIN